MKYAVFLVTLLGSCSLFPARMALEQPPVIQMQAQEITNDTADSSSEYLPPIFYALSLIGYHEQEHRDELTEFLDLDPVETPWCAAFVNSVLAASGMQGTDSLLARSFIEWGDPQEVPQVGDIVVFSRPPTDWQGHVGFFINSEVIDGVEYYRVLGGNQSDMVSIDLYPVSRLLSIRKM